jgi:putative peptide zinc metalloprotease protein
MSNRSTFHESWYKVADLLPQIHISLKISRQKYRGHTWHVVQDPGNNQFFRINTAAYQFLAYLDGRRSVDKAWNTCYEEYGDEAPTQGEAITLLGQLYSSNLLQGDVPADTEGLLKRHRKRQTRETTAFMKGILFARIPLFNPDRFLNRWVFLFGPIFSKFGYLLGIILIGLGLTFLFNNFEALERETQDTLSLSNLPWLYLMFAVTKLLHEFGHGFACKYYGKKTKTGGNVNTMGLAFLLLTPVPYVDASSSWAFKNKWMRAAVAAAGMYVELLFAAIAVIVWSQTSPGDTLHVISFNVMFISSITTILFNGNPLLRYDAYYMLADTFEIPNLSGRSKLHMKYLFRKFIFGIRKATSPSYDNYEGWFMVLYAILSEIYKFVIFASIVFLLSEFSPVLGLLGLALYGFSAFVMPAVKFFRYLFTNAELARTRTRSLIISFAALALVLYFVAGIKLSDRVVVEGVIEPVELKHIHVQADGFVNFHVSRQLKVNSDETQIYQAENPELLLKIAKAEAEIEKLKILIRAYAGIEPARKEIHQNSYNALMKKIELLKKEKRELTIKAPLSGLFIPDENRDLTGKFIPKGQKLGIIISPDQLIIRSIIDQDTVRVLDSAENKVQFRLRSRPDETFTATVQTKRQAGLSKLPSAALGYHGGGEVDVKATEQGTESKEFFFEIILKPEKSLSLRPGQIVAVRFAMDDKTIFSMLKGFVNRLLLKRFRI